MILPTGIIVLWQGSVASIPAGWLLCDGTSGTPDLTDKFVRGAGDTFNPNDTGGSIQHAHSFTGDGHTHTLVAGSGVAGGVVLSTTTNSVQVTGSSGLADNIPPFYALAYIMKS